MNNLKVVLAILIFLSYANTLLGQDMKFAIQTNDEKAIKIHDNSSGEEYMLQSYIRSGSGCLIDCVDTKKLFLENISNENIKVKILSINSQEQTTDFWLLAGSNQQLSFLLSEYNIGMLYATSSILNRITSFFSGKKNIEFGKNAVLRNANENLVFNHTDSLIIAELDDFSLSWNTSSTLAKISILKDDTQKEIWSDENVRYEVLDLSKLINTKTDRSILEKGENYTLNITLKDELDANKSHRLNFYLLSEAELNILKTYVDSLNNKNNIILNGNFNH